jgi:hypothetical protein
MTGALIEHAWAAAKQNAVASGSRSGTARDRAYPKRASVGTRGGNRRVAFEAQEPACSIEDTLQENRFYIFEQPLTDPSCRLHIAGDTKNDLHLS